LLNTNREEIGFAFLLRHGKDVGFKGITEGKGGVNILKRMLQNLWMAPKTYQLLLPL
jgi:hypothetical protein